MSQMKNWMMDMEEQSVSAIESGARNETDVLAYVKTKMPFVDETYVKKYTTTIMGELSIEEIIS